MDQKTVIMDEVDSTSYQLLSDQEDESDSDSDGIEFFPKLAQNQTLDPEAHSLLVRDVVLPMVRRGVKRKLVQSAPCDLKEINQGHLDVIERIVSSSVKHISLSALHSTLSESLEMVDLATVLTSDTADKHRPAYLHPYDDGDLGDVLKSSLSQAKAVALTEGAEEEQKKREIQELVDAEVATGISTYLYTQPDGEEVYVVRFDISPSRQDKTKTYYAFLELVAVDEDTPNPWVGVRFGAHTAPDFVDVRGVAKEQLGEDGIVDVKDSRVKAKIADFCWEVYKRLWGYEARRCVGERLLAEKEGGDVTGLHDKPWELVTILVSGVMSTEVKFAFDDPTSKLPTRLKLQFLRDDEVVEGEKKQKAWVGKVCKEEGLEGIEKVVEYMKVVNAMAGEINENGVASGDENK